MTKEIKVRWGWLKGMYVYTIVVAGGFGLGTLFIPKLIQSIFNMPAQDPIVVGVMGSVYVAFALLSLLGLRSPLKWSPDFYCCNCAIKWSGLLGSFFLF